MKTDTMKVVAAFQAASKNGALRKAKDFSLKRLKDADENLGSRDAKRPFRLLLKDRIKTLEERNAKGKKQKN